MRVGSLSAAFSLSEGGSSCTGQSRSTASREWSIGAFLGSPQAARAQRSTELLEQLLLLQQAKKIRPIISTGNDEASAAFLMTMNHELRTPLSAALGTLELLGDSAHDRCSLATLQSSCEDVLQVRSSVKCSPNKRPNAVIFPSDHIQL